MKTSNRMIGYVTHLSEDTCKDFVRGHDSSGKDKNYIPDDFLFAYSKQLPKISVPQLP